MQHVYTSYIFLTNPLQTVNCYHKYTILLVVHGSLSTVSKRIIYTIYYVTDIEIINPLTTGFMLLCG